MAARYRKIDPRVWDDQKFRAMNMEERLAWFYVLTGPDANSVGLYRFSIERFARHVGVQMATARRLIAVLVSRGMVHFDADESLLWVPRWLEYNPPAGTNQATSYMAIATDFVPHRFAVALRLTLVVSASTISGVAPISKKQAIVIRDGVACVYCQGVFTSTDEIELDHVLPKSRSEDGGNRYNALVASCRKCNQKKGTLTAEEFGFPFVAGREYSIPQALGRLLFESPIRNAFARVYHGLPSVLAGIDEVIDLFEFSHITGRRSDAVRTASREHHNGVAIQEQEQRAGAGAESRSRSREHKESEGTLPRATRTTPRKRMPEDFVLTDERLAEGLVEGLTEALTRREFAKLKDYEFKTAKRDWDAVWRNWVRTAAERAPNGSGRTPGSAAPFRSEAQDAENRRTKYASAERIMAEQDQRRAAKRAARDQAGEPDVVVPVR